MIEIYMGEMPGSDSVETLLEVDEVFGPAATISSRSRRQEIEGEIRSVLAAEQQLFLADLRPQQNST